MNLSARPAALCQRASLLRLLLVLSCDCIKGDKSLPSSLGLFDLYEWLRAFARAK